jgi:hypothetical protein
VLRDRAGGYCLEGACINAGEVDGATVWKKEKGTCVDVDGVNKDVIGWAVGCCEA